jgi:predicted nucleic acid-binding protein
LVRESILVSKNQRLPFWDTLIVTAAARSGAETLYSESLPHSQSLLGVRIMNPFL